MNVEFTTVFKLRDGWIMGGRSGIQGIDYLLAAASRPDNRTAAIPLTKVDRFHWVGLLCAHRNDRRTVSAPAEAPLVDEEVEISWDIGITEVIRRESDLLGDDGRRVMNTLKEIDQRRDARSQGLGEAPQIAPQLIAISVC